MFIQISVFRQMKQVVIFGKPSCHFRRVLFLRSKFHFEKSNSFYHRSSNFLPCHGDSLIPVRHSWPWRIHPLGIWSWCNPSTKLKGTKMLMFYIGFPTSGCFLRRFWRERPVSVHIAESKYPSKMTLITVCCITQCMEKNPAPWKAESLLFLLVLQMVGNFRFHDP